MGKGSRNRQIHLQDKVENPQKYKAKKVKKPMPQWAKTTISIVLLVAVLFGVGALIFNKYGIIERNRIIIESKTGEFDVNQQIATYVAWQNIYYEATMEWMYMKYGLLEDTYGITKQGTDTYIEQERYALAMAQTYLKTNLRDAIDASLPTLLELVAVCDEAYTNNYHLDDKDQTTVEKSMTSLTEMALSYNYLDLSGFLTDNMFSGMLESDVRRAVEMSTLYNKYKTHTQVKFEMAITPEDLIAFRDAHPEDFFKIDYISYSTTDKTFADRLMAESVTNADEFKALILEKHFNDNYKTTYNKYVTQAAVTDIYNEVKSLFDTAESSALSDKLDAYEFSGVTTYKKDEDHDDALEKWIYDTGRKQYDVATFTNQDATGVYIVAFYSAAPGNMVEIREKFYAFDEGDSFTKEDGTLDNAFKDTIWNYLVESKKDKPSFPTVTYLDAAKKGANFKEACEKLANADAKLNYFKENGAVEVKGVSTDSSEDKLPSSLRNDLILLAPSEIGSIYVINDGVVSYVVYVTAINEAKEEYDIWYVTIEADEYYLIINDLTASLNKDYPTDKTATLTASPAAGSFDEWISQRGNSPIESARKEFDKKLFSTTSKNDAGVETTSHTIYMVVNTPMYLDETVAANGAYIPFYGVKDGMNATQQAEAAMELLKGKTYAEAIAAIQSLTDNANNVSPTVSSTITAESLANYAQLKKWFFEEERQPNEMAILGEQGKSEVYLAFCIEKGITWKNLAKEGAVNEDLTNWVTGLTSTYTINQNALDAIGAPTTTTAPATTA